MSELHFIAFTPCSIRDFGQLRWF